MPCLIRVFLHACILVAALNVSPTFGQIPDEFTNLKRLEPSIEKAELVSIMRGFSSGLGVRCNHCHVGPENLQGMDFATDEKATKRTARRMLAMVQSLNSEYLVDLPATEDEGREAAQSVVCYTCHRGLPNPPRQTIVELSDVARHQGVDAALAEFQRLRNEHEDAGRYDLRPGSLFDFARGLIQAGQPQSALPVMDALHELAPDMGDGYALRAQVEVLLGRFDAARQHLDQARKVEPDARLADWVGRLLLRAEASRNSSSSDS